MPSLKNLIDLRSEHKYMSLLPLFIPLWREFILKCLLIFSILVQTLEVLLHGPHAFWKYLTEKLGNCGLPQAPFDPCLFIGKKVIAICYVNNLIYWARNEKDIVYLAVQICALKEFI
ncbi:LOW QUALITY PROTEIN: hypothetical protein ACHAXS_011899 [Conticribra weissflogii]